MEGKGGGALGRKVLFGESKRGCFKTKERGKKGHLMGEDCKT